MTGKPERIHGPGHIERRKVVQEQAEREELERLVIYEARKGRSPAQIASYTGLRKAKVITILRLAGIRSTSASKERPGEASWSRACPRALLTPRPGAGPAISV